MILEYSILLCRVSASDDPSNSWICYWYFTGSWCHQWFILNILTITKIRISWPPLLRFLSPSQLYQRATKLLEYPFKLQISAHEITVITKALMPRFIRSSPDSRQCEHESGLRGSLMDSFLIGGRRRNGWSGSRLDGWGRRELASNWATEFPHLTQRGSVCGPTLRVFCQHQLCDIYSLLPHVPGATIGHGSRHTQA